MIFFKPTWVNHDGMFLFLNYHNLYKFFIIQMASQSFLLIYIQMVADLLLEGKEDLEEEL